MKFKGIRLNEKLRTKLLDSSEIGVKNVRSYSL